MKLVKKEYINDRINRKEKNKKRKPKLTNFKKNQLILKKLIQNYKHNSNKKIRSNQSYKIRVKMTYKKNNKKLIN